MFPCNFCNLKFSKIIAYDKHLVVHKNVLNGVYYCFYPHCCMQFRKYNNFKHHVYRQHNQNIIADNEKLNILTHCSVNNCSFKDSERKKLVAHLIKHIKKGQSITCPFEKCSSSKLYDKVSNFRMHNYRNHSKQVKVNIIEVETSSNLMPSSAFFDDQYSLSRQTKETFCTLSNNVESSYISSLSDVYLTLQCKSFLNDTSLQMLIDSLYVTHEFSVSLLKEKLAQFSIAPDVSEAIISEFDVFSRLHYKENGIFRSTFTRKKFYKENNCNYIEPAVINLGRNKLNKMCHFVYIPLIETIKKLLTYPIINNFCRNNCRNSSDLKHIQDGILFQRKTPLKKPFLQIMLHQDIFEVCNPLGSAKSKSNKVKSNKKVIIIVTFLYFIINISRFYY